MPKGKGKHLDISDRFLIQECLKEGTSLSAIARKLGVSTSTVSREIRNNRTRYLTRDASRHHDLCVHHVTCTVTGLCDVKCKKTSCERCRSALCPSLCAEYEERTCEQLERAPFVCDGCKRRANCGYRRARYSARDAQTSYEKRLCDSRRGVSVTPEQLESMVAHARRLMAQGQSLEAIWAANPTLFPVSARTFRGYVDRGVFGLANIELPKKVKYRPRKKAEGATAPVVAGGRAYADFLALGDDVRRGAFQLDSIMGRVHDSQCALSIHLPRLEFQAYLLLCLVKSPFRKCASISLGCGHETFSDFVTPTRQCLSAADARDGATPLRGHHGVAPIVVRTEALLTPLPRRVHRG